MEKKEYEAPKMLIVELSTDSALLQCSSNCGDDDGPEGIVTNDGFFD